MDITVISWGKLLISFPSPNVKHSSILDDRFVDEIRQSFAACAVFMLIPVFNLADGGLGNSQNDMSIAMMSVGSYPVSFQVILTVIYAQ